MKPNAQKIVAACIVLASWNGAASRMSTCITSAFTRARPKIHRLRSMSDRLGETLCWC